MWEPDLPTTATASLRRTIESGNPHVLFARRGRFTTKWSVQRIVSSSREPAPANFVRNPSSSMTGGMRTYKDYQLDTATIDQWMLDNTIPAQSPLQALANNRDQAVAQAIARADATNKAAKVVLSTPWVVCHGSGDLHYAMGSFSVSCTTVVVARPGAAGKHPVRLLQQAHVVDVYDYRKIVKGDEASSGILPDSANNIAYRGMTLGIAKPFLDYGSGSQVPWQGLR